ELGWTVGSLTKRTPLPAPVPVVETLRAWSKLTVRLRVEFGRGGERRQAEVESPFLSRALDECARAWRENFDDYRRRQFAIVREAAARLLDSDAFRAKGIDGLGPGDVALTEQVDLVDPAAAVLRAAR